MSNVLITGTSTGIAQTTALHLARQGYLVYATMTDSNKGQLLIAASRDADLEIEVVEQDVCSSASNRRAFDEIMSKAGRLSVLINNVGIGGGVAIEETPEEVTRSRPRIESFRNVDGRHPDTIAANARSKFRQRNLIYPSL